MTVSVIFPLYTATRNFLDVSEVQIPAWIQEVFTKVLHKQLSQAIIWLKNIYTYEQDNEEFTSGQITNEYDPEYTTSPGNVMALACMVKNIKQVNFVFTDDVTPGDEYTTVLSAQIKQNPARIS